MANQKITEKSEEIYLKLINRLDAETAKDLIDHQTVSTILQSISTLGMTHYF